MNAIFVCDGHLGAVTDTVKAEAHKHWIPQLFICGAGALDIAIEGKTISCAGVVVDKNTAHKFAANGQIHFTMLIDPVSSLARRMASCFAPGQPFYLLPDGPVRDMQRMLGATSGKVTLEALGDMIACVYAAFAEALPVPEFSAPVARVLGLLDGCGCEEKHRMSRLAEAVALSPSRLAHRFKAETGVPLKSYGVLHALKKAYEELARGGSVTEAAMAAGFDSPSHLAYTNKRMTGMSASGITKDSVFLKVVLKQR